MICIFLIQKLQGFRFEASEWTTRPQMHFTVHLQESYIFCSPNESVFFMSSLLIFQRMMLHTGLCISLDCS